MIKKITIATFKNGEYAGEYDWTGGIPLSVGESITIIMNSGIKLIYTLNDKHTTLVDNGQDQEVTINYFFGITT